MKKDISIIAYLAYGILFIRAYAFLKQHVFLPYAEDTKVLPEFFCWLILLSMLSGFVLSFLVICNRLGCCKEWGIDMIKNWRGWVLVIVSTIAFSVLMFIICRNMESTAKTVGVVVSAVLLFMPNMYALVSLLIKGKES